MWKKSKQLGLVYIGVWNIFLDKVIHFISTISAELKSDLKVLFSAYPLSHHLLFRYYHVSVSLDYLCPLELTCNLLLCASVYTTFSLCIFKIIHSFWVLEFSLHGLSSPCVWGNIGQLYQHLLSAGRVGASMRRDRSTPHLLQMRKELQHAVFLWDRYLYILFTITTQHVLPSCYVSCLIHFNDI